MKFGENLAACVYEPWLPHYIDYAALKALVRTHCPPEAFLLAVGRELAKAEAFLEATLPTLARPLHHLDAHGALPRACFRALCQDLGYVREHMLVNYLAALKIAKKYDRRVPGPRGPVSDPIALLLRGSVVVDVERLGALLLAAEGLAASFLESARPPSPSAAEEMCPRC